MLRFFMKTVAKDTARNMAGQLVGTGIFMGMSTVANLANGSRAFSYSGFSIFHSAVPNPNTTSLAPNPSPTQEMSSSFSLWKS